MSTTALTAVLAKLAGLSTVAKAGVGLAVTAGVLGATAAVPAVAGEIRHVGDEQVVVATTDESTTDVTADPTAEPTDDPTAEPTDDPTAEPTDDPTVALPGWRDTETFGAWVSAQAREGGVDGQQIALAAHERNQLRAENRLGEGTDESPATGDQDNDQDEVKDQDNDQDEVRDQDKVKDQDKDKARDRD